MQAISINGQTPQNRTRILKPQAQLSLLPNTSTEVFEPGQIEYYQGGPSGKDWNQNLMSLATFATNFTITSKQMTSSNQPNLKTFEK